MTAVEKYIKELMRSRDLAVSRFDNLSSIETRLIDSSFNWLINNLDISGGTFVVSDSLNKQMNDFVNSVLKTVNTSKQYKTKISSYLRDLKGIGDHIRDFQQDVNNIDWKKAKVSDVQKGMIEVTVDALTDNGLNQHFAQPLKDIVQTNVAAGMNQKQAKDYLTDFISSGKDKSGKLKQYLHNTSIQAVQLYEGAINTKLIQEFEFTGFNMAGSLIATSSPQCKKAIDESDNGYITNEHMQGIIEYAKTLKNDGGLVPNTTIKNVPVHLLHFGCRHSFTPIIKNPKN